MLDQFDQEVLSASGKAKDLIREFYGAKISQNNAQKQMAGIRRHLRTKKRMAEPEYEDLEEIEVKADGTRTTKRMILLSESDKQNPNIILSRMGLDPLKWELVSHKMRRNYWNVITKDSRDEAQVNTAHAYMCTVTVKPIQNIVSSDHILELLDTVSPPELIEYEYNPGNCLLELPIMDVHLGKLAWGKETGEDYDLKIAIELYRKTIIDILEKVKRLDLPIELIEFPVGQDFFHVDNAKNETTAGTPLDVDTRFLKMFDEGIEALVWAVEELRQIAPVNIRWVCGNHDKTIGYFAIAYLSAYFRDCSGVNADLSKEFRKYVLYGVNLIGFSHGKEGKRIHHLMQQEQPEAWGKTLFREWHLGDLHHEETDEIGGIKIRRISSITAIDAWHAEKGYRAVRMAQAFVWDKEKGKQYTIDSNVIIENG
jgi:hypothetical protein